MKNNMGKKKILIVEDDSTLQKALGEYLLSEGFEVEIALDGEEGIRRAKKTNPNLVVLDIILPRKDGYEVLKELKDDENTKNTPVILLTNLRSLSDVEKAIKMGATTYLIKADYTLEDVVKKIREILNI